VKLIVMVAGFLAEVAGWRAAANRPVWRVMPWVLGVAGLAAVAVSPPVAAVRVGDGAALGAGLVSGLGLYAATLLVVSVAARVGPVARQVSAIYGEAVEVSARTALVLSLLVMVPAEELFWRGLVQQRLDADLSAWVAAAATWLAYVLANVASLRLPIVAGAAVGGALWAALAAWSGGMLSSVASHMLWTGMMLALPPGAGRKERAP
jgi:membrane protease YdiL (CAAX protease family)